MHILLSITEYEGCGTLNLYSLDQWWPILTHSSGGAESLDPGKVGNDWLAEPYVGGKKILTILTRTKPISSFILLKILE